MNQKEKTAIAWLGYLCAVVMAAAYSIEDDGPSTFFVIPLVVGLFGLGWFACRVDLEHQAAKVAAPEQKPTGPDEEEKKWRAMLVKRGPLE